MAIDPRDKDAIDALNADTPQVHPEDQATIDSWNKGEPYAAPEQSGLLRRYVADPAISALKGAIGLPEAGVGLLDMPTLGLAGKAAEGLGIKFKEARETLDTLYSPEQKEAFAKVQAVKGFVPSLIEAVKRPSTIAHSVIESLPSIVGGGAIARSLLKIAPKMGLAAIGAGEGAISAGQQAEQSRQESKTGLITGGQALTAAASGALTGLIGVVGGKLAKRFGWEDIDVLVATGKSSVGNVTRLNLLKKVITGAISEGAFEELPQSAQEQVASNIAAGRPPGEGVAQAAAQGMLAGMVMGGGGNIASHFMQKIKNDPINQEIEKQMKTDTEMDKAVTVAGLEESLITGVPLDNGLGIETMSGEEESAKTTSTDVAAKVPVPPAVESVSGEIVAGNIAAESETALKSTSEVPAEVSQQGKIAANQKLILEQAAAYDRAKSAGATIKDVTPAGYGPTEERRGKPTSEVPGERRKDPETRKRIAEMSIEEARVELGTDHLTKLENKRLYEEKERKPVQASLDVDGLKTVNDTYGHEAGNDLLKAVGTALKESGLPDVYHFHGDEFHAEGNTTEEVTQAMDKTKEYLKNTPLTFKDKSGASHTVNAGFSYGVGATQVEAETGLQTSKAARIKSGEAAKRGEPLPVSSKTLASGDAAVQQKLTERAATKVTHENNRKTFQDLADTGKITPELHTEVKGIIDYHEKRGNNVSIIRDPEATVTKGDNPIPLINDPNTPDGEAFMVKQGYTPEQILTAKEEGNVTKIRAHNRRYYDDDNRLVRQEIILYDSAVPESAREEFVHSLQATGELDPGTTPEGVTQRVHEERHAAGILAQMEQGKSIDDVIKEANRSKEAAKLKSKVKGSESESLFSAATNRSRAGITQEEARTVAAMRKGLNNHPVLEEAAKGLDPDDLKVWNEIRKLAGGQWFTDHNIKAVFGSKKVLDRMQQVIRAYRMFDAKEMMAISKAGESGLGWYENSRRFIQHIFPIETHPYEHRTFAQLLAGTSSGQNPIENLAIALRAWVVWEKAGRPTSQSRLAEIFGKDNFLAGYRGTVQRQQVRNVFAGGYLGLKGNFKQPFFSLNIRGFLEFFTSDLWVARQVGNELVINSKKTSKENGAIQYSDSVKKMLSNPMYFAMSARSTQIAKKMNLPVAVVQETMWTFTRALYATLDTNALNSTDLFSNRGGKAKTQAQRALEELSYQDVYDQEDYLTAAITALNAKEGVLYDAIKRFDAYLNGRTQGKLGRDYLLGIQNARTTRGGSVFGNQTKRDQELLRRFADRQVIVKKIMQAENRKANEKQKKRDAAKKAAGIEIPKALSPKVRLQNETIGDLFNVGVEEKLDNGVKEKYNISKIHSMIMSNPNGFTLNISDGTLQTKGYSVSPSRMTDTRFDAVTEQNVRDFLYKFQSVFDSDDRAFLGGWFDKETKKYVLDVSFVVDNEKEALYLAEIGGQDAIYWIDGPDPATNEIRTADGIAKLKQGNLYSESERDALRGVREGLHKIIEGERDNTGRADNAGERPADGQSSAVPEKRAREEVRFSVGTLSKQEDLRVKLALRKDPSAGALKEFKNKPIVLTHWSKDSKLSSTDPSKHGTGYAGAEGKNKAAYLKLWLDKSYYGYGTYEAEAGLGRHRYGAKVDGNKIYDSWEDPLKLYPSAAETRKLGYNTAAAQGLIYEQRISAAGFLGSAVSPYQAVALFKPVDVKAQSASDQVVAQDRFSVGGEKALTSNTASKAKQLEKQGMDRQAIWKQTGWWKQAGDWKFEIDDSQFEFLKPEVGTEILTLPEVFSHPTLYNLYPFLKKIKIDAYIQEPHYPEIGGSFDDKTKRINAASKTVPELKELVIHEIQHAIQEHEGFARGGSPEGLETRALTKKGGNDFDTYLRLGGEAESRLVAERMSMSSKERSIIPPWKTLEGMLKKEGLLKRGQSAEKVIIDTRNTEGLRAARPNAWSVEEPTKLDDVIRVMSDKFIDLKKAYAAATAGTSIQDARNPVLQQELYSSKVKYQVEDIYQRQELAPFLKKLDTSGVSAEEIHEYAHNRHAEEANKYIATINPDYPDGGSGIMTADAKAYLAGLKPDQKAEYDRLMVDLDAMAKKSAQMLVSFGLETQDTIDKWNATYQYYAPLFREEMEGGLGTGQGFSVVGPSSKGRKGSGREVSNIISNIARQREKYLTLGYKNNLNRAMIYLAEKFPNTDFWRLARPDIVERIVVATGVREKVIDPAYMNRKNVIMARVPTLNKKTGKIEIVARGIEFNTDSDRAKRTAAAMKNLDLEKLGHILGWSAKVTRFIAKMNTQYNPVFGITNFLRDWGTGMLNISTTEIKDKKADVFKNSIPALMGILSITKANRNGTTSTNPWAAAWKDFAEHGGPVGYRDLFRTSEDRVNAIKREISQLQANKILKGGYALANILSDYNSALENAVRLSAYKSGVDSGMSKDRAASMAKNLTVNFDKKGTISQQAGSLYAFFNASVQGSVRMAETLAGPAGKKIVAGGIILGVVQAAMLAAAGFDDDEPPEFIQERNIIIPLGGKKYATIPMPLGFHVLPNIGRISSQWAMGGFKDPMKKMGALVSTFAESFNPLGSSGVSLQTFAPTPLDPFVALSENKDWTGKPIYRENWSSLDPTPGHTRSKDTASLFGKGLSWALNKITGGDDYIPGMMSPTPDQIDYLTGQLTGGVGREAGKAMMVGQTLLTGEDLPTFKIPLASRFYGDSAQASNQSSKFYENLKLMNTHGREIKGRQEHREELGSYLSDNPEARMFRMAKTVESSVSRLNDRKKEMKARDASPEAIKTIDVAIAARMKQFNEKVKELKS